MRLYRSKIPNIATRIVSKLISDGDLEIDSSMLVEVQQDIEAILKEYLRVEGEVITETKRLMAERELPYHEFGRMRREVAKQRDFASGDEGLAWCADQILRSFMIGDHVEEIWAEDRVMRKKMMDTFRDNLVDEEELDIEVRGRLKNIDEDDPKWKIEYERVMKLVKKRRGLA